MKKGHNIKKSIINGIPAITLTWNEADKSSAIKEIEQILTMKVGKRCQSNEIYWKVNDFCNTLPLNASYQFLAAECRKHFNNVPGIDSIISVVLD